MANRHPSVRGQAGATMVEFAITVSLFLLLVLGLMEFTLLVLDISRANEVTRQLSRTAIVSDPVCDIFDGSCPGAVSGLACPDGDPVVVSLDQFNTNNCRADATDTPCRMLNAAQALLPTVQASQVEITYACSGTGFADRPRAIPLVTVALRGLERPFLFAGFLGLDRGIEIPGFAITRTGEDLYTERQQ